MRAARLAEAAALPDLERSAAALFAGAGELAWIAGHEPTPADFYPPLIAAGSVWVADAGPGGLAGFVSAETVERELHVWELAVAEPFQRRGIGRRLMAAAIGHARALGLASVTLTTFRDVAWNGPFYESLGFAPVDPWRLEPRLDDLLRGEAARGLPAERRCAMRLAL